jgi:predicted RNA-binding protein YlqC (UPF0109 family)
MSERPGDIIDYEDEEARPPKTAAIDFDDDDALPHAAPETDPSERQASAHHEPNPDELERRASARREPRSGELGDEEPREGGDGIGRAAAVLKYIVEQIVDEPDQISIGATTDDRGPVLLLRVAEDDRGKVIGRQGRIVQAIRTIVKAASVGSGEKVSVEILD